jgi:hypothetical protein
MYRANTLCPNKQVSEVELERVRKDVVSTAYPVCLVESVTHMKPESRCKEAMGSLCVYISISYVRGVSQKFRRISGPYIFG